MVRTAATGIRVSAGKSSKKMGRASTQNTSSGTGSDKSGGSSTKLPPIPHQETPSWQKPITNFFKSNSPLKATDNKTEKEVEAHEQEDDDAGSSKKKLKFDNEESKGPNNSEEHREINDETTVEENKENALEDMIGVNQAAGTSKQ